MPAQIRLHEFQTASEAKMQVLKAENISEVNDEANAKHIVPRTGAIVIGDGAVQTFPASSVTVITINKQ